MTESIYRHYERELLFIRQMAQEFARQYPAAAGRLLPSGAAGGVGIRLGSRGWLWPYTVPEGPIARASNSVV